MEKVFKAIDFAQKAHCGQLRKSTQIPYIIHPLGVMEILLRHNCSKDAAIAGILHDTIEDTPITAEDIEKEFGTKIKYLVIAASEPDKSASWEERKQHTMEFLSSVNDEEVLCVTCADKMHNLLSIVKDYETIGDKVWDRFNRGKESQKWYYTSLAKIFMAFNNKNPLFNEFYNLANKFF